MGFCTHIRVLPVYPRPAFMLPRVRSVGPSRWEVGPPATFINIPHARPTSLHGRGCWGEVLHFCGKCTVGAPLHPRRCRANGDPAMRFVSSHIGNRTRHRLVVSQHGDTKKKSSINRSLRLTSGMKRRDIHGRCYIVQGTAYRSRSPAHLGSLVNAQRTWVSNSADIIGNGFGFWALDLCGCRSGVLTRLDGSTAV